MIKKAAVTVMLCDAQLAKIAYEQGNMVKAAYYYGEFFGIHQLVGYEEIKEYTTLAERKDMVETIEKLTNVIMKAMEANA